jgi:hypothetical protein
MFMYKLATKSCLPRIDLPDNLSVYPKITLPDSFTTFRQSLANLKPSAYKSAARAIPSLHVIDSITSGSTMPRRTNAEAPIK